MKNIIVFISFIILLKPAFPVLEYAVNYDYISKVLCVNKAQPKLHCNGKCHLMKELAKSAEGEKPATPEKKSFTNDLEVVFCESLYDFNLRALISGLHAKADTAYPDFKPSGFHMLLLKPPIALS